MKREEQPDVAQLQSTISALEQLLEVQEQCVVEQSDNMQSLLRDLNEWNAEMNRLNEALRTEVAERKRAEQVIAENQAKLRAIFDAATEDSIIATGPDGLITAFNSGAEKMLGYSAEEMIGKQTPAVLHLESEVAACGKELTERLGRPIQGFDVFVERTRQGGAEEREWTYIRKNGTHLTVRLAVTALKDQQGNIIGFLGIASDITAQKRAEAAVQRDSKEQYRALFESSRDALLLLDQQGFFDCNAAAVQLFGAASKAQLIGIFPWDMSPPTQPDGVESLVAAKDRIAKAYEQGSQFFEWLHRRQDGSLFSADVLLSRYERRGKPVLQADIRDITDRKRVEQTLRESEEKFRTVTESAVEGVVILDSDDKVSYWNPSAEQIFGYPAQAALGRLLRDLIVPARHRKAHQEGLERFRASGQGCLIGKTVEVEALRSDGREIPIDLSISAMMLDGRWQAIGVMRDASARKREEIDAWRRGEAETMRHLLEGLTHGLKNPLFILTGRLRLLHDKLTQPGCADLKMDVEKIKSAVQRLSAAVEHFSTFTAVQQSKPEPCSVGGALREAVAFLVDHLHHGHIALVKHVAPDLPPVSADPRQFRQMFLTLMLYAVEAMCANRRGTLTVEAKLVTDTGTRGRGDTASPASAAEGDWIEVRIAHDGESLPDEKLATLFEPFSALSGPNGGLGLWPVRMTSMVLNGTVTCESRAGQGATFLVRLPGQPGMPGSPAPKDSPARIV